MTVQEQDQVVTATCQRHDKASDVKCENIAASVPVNWQLTPQQQAFIDLFSEDPRT